VFPMQAGYDHSELVRDAALKEFVLQPFICPEFAPVEEFYITGCVFKTHGDLKGLVAAADYQDVDHARTRQ
ncbi:MAG: hypothetical protein K6T74_07220, partial [Geminicoccaceae bacterium]|nr:hypothetical protein [Geminicoccaceae bacterium]